MFLGLRTVTSSAPELDVANRYLAGSLEIAPVA